jgi:hypothetical protein
MPRKPRRAGKFRKYPEKSAVMNFRITPSTRQLLERAAEASGRTISSECEHQLQRALSDIGAGPSHALMAVIGRTIDDLVRMRERGAKLKASRWWDDPYTFDLAARAVTAAFEMFRPKGKPSESDGRQGEFAIEATLREIQLVDLSIPFDQLTPHQRWLALLKRDLGPLADRPTVWWAESAPHARVRERAREALRELIPLSQKAERAPDAMTPKETEKLRELRAAIVKISEEEFGPIQEHDRLK